MRHTANQNNILFVLVATCSVPSNSSVSSLIAPPTFSTTTPVPYGQSVSFTCKRYNAIPLTLNRTCVYDLKKDTYRLGLNPNWECPGSRSLFVYMNLCAEILVCMCVCMYVTGHLYSTFCEPQKGTQTVLKRATKYKIGRFLSYLQV